MSNVVTFPKSGVGSPEWRAALLAEAIRRTASVRGPISVTALQHDLIEWTGLPEEQCSSEIFDVTFFLVRCGFYTCNTHDRVRNEITIGAGTTLTVTNRLVLYIHEFPDFGPTEDTAA